MTFRLYFAAAVLVVIAGSDSLLARKTADVDSRSFTITASDALVAAETRDVLVKAVSDAEEILGDTVAPRISVHIVDTRQEFNQMIRGGMPDWGVGCAIPSRNLIVVLSSRSSEYEQSFAEILRHEWGHIALRHKIGSAYLPRFLDEGFAMDFAGQWNTGLAVTLAKAQLMGTLFRLRSIDRVNFFNSSEAQIAYAQSYQAMKYISSAYDNSSFLILLDQLKRGISLDPAMYSAIGADFDTFESEYTKYLEQHYSWLLIFSDMTFVWIGLALLIVVGFLLKKRRGRDTIKRWEEEEKYESTDFDYEEGDPWD
ncbi:MAG: hypothetical protein ABIK83_03310 [Candidatus Zixiibacteriota bacterium]